LNEFLTWDYLGTFGGASLAVTLLTQAVKGYLKDVDPKIIALCWAILIMLGAEFITSVGTSTVSGVLMAAMNALLVAGASVGLFETAKSVANREGI